MIVDYLFHISHDFGVSSLCLGCHMVDRLASRLKHSGRLRMQYKWYRE